MIAAPNKNQENNQDTGRELDEGEKNASETRASVAGILNVGDTAEKAESKVDQKARELKEENPTALLREITGNIEKYIRLRMLSEATDAQDLPEELAEEISYGSPMDAFLDGVNDNQDLWDDFQDQFGPAEDSDTPQWSIQELEQLVSKLKQ